MMPSKDCLRALNRIVGKRGQSPALLVEALSAVGAIGSGWMELRSTGSLVDHTDPAVAQAAYDAWWKVRLRKGGMTDLR